VRKLDGLGVIIIFITIIIARLGNGINTYGVIATKVKIVHLSDALVLVIWIQLVKATIGTIFPITIGIIVAIKIKDIIAQRYGFPATLGVTVVTIYGPTTIVIHVKVVIGFGSTGPEKLIDIAIRIAAENQETIIKVNISQVELLAHYVLLLAPGVTVQEVLLVIPA
jgi:hypothetical protein